MPVILAIEASTDACSVGLLTNRGITEQVSPAAREHTRYLLPMVETLLSENNLTISDLDAIAFGRGPGSFTGLRIGLSVAQGLAYGADLPLVDISGLEAMAHKVQRLVQVDKPMLAVPVIDARMNEVYFSAYELMPDQSPTAVIEEQVDTPDACRQTIEQLLVRLPTSPELIGVGSGWHYDAITSLPCDQIDAQAFPSAYDIIELAKQRYARGETINALQAQPHYLRNEINWKKRKRVRQ